MPRFAQQRKNLCDAGADYQFIHRYCFGLLLFLEKKRKNGTSDASDFTGSE